eukprot:3081126-Amphidinium_carterae.1
MDDTPKPCSSCQCCHFLRPTASHIDNAVIVFRLTAKIHADRGANAAPAAEIALTTWALVV